MARVNLEQAAHTDPRFALLGKRIGHDRHSALGRMTMVWAACQERGSYTLPVDILDCFFEDVTNFADAIVQSGLGRLEPDGTIYICGTRGRIEWLTRKREVARENGAKSSGRPRKKDIAQETNVGFQGNQDRFPSADPPALAPVPSPAPVEESTSPLPPAAAGGAETRPKEAPKRERRRKPATFMTEDWKPTPDVDKELRTECPRVDHDEALREFRLYWIGEGRAKADWIACYRNRIRELSSRGDGNRLPRGAGRKAISYAGDDGTKRTAASFGMREWDPSTKTFKPASSPEPMSRSLE